MSIPAKASIIHCRSRENGNLSNQPCLSISPTYDSQEKLTADNWPLFRISSLFGFWNLDFRFLWIIVGWATPNGYVHTGEGRYLLAGQTKPCFDLFEKNNLISLRQGQVFNLTAPVSSLSESDGKSYSKIIVLAIK
jgi:hypothetical protein